MLEPDARHMMTDALRPPEGYQLDIAVATTYSLSLTSLILAPLAMAAHDQISNGSDNAPDPTALLESVRRYAERTTVFCHVGAIHVPGTYQRIMAFAEDSVVEVRPKAVGNVFHPKIWVLRFINPPGDKLHRFACLSRNLTEDKSWDTVLVMDEAADLVGADTAPLVSFLRALPNLTMPGKPLSADLALQIDDLTKSLKRVRLEVPEPFEAAELWPMGMTGGRGWPFPEQVEDLFVISPFVDAGFLQDMPTTDQPWLVSRPETLDRLGADAIPDGCVPYVLAPAADTDELDLTDELSETTDLSETADLDAAGGLRDVLQPSTLEVSSGLHAKTFVWEDAARGHVFSGSANATGAAFSGNVEFSVLLSGPRSSCGTETLLEDINAGPDSRKTKLVFAHVIEAYEIRSTEPTVDASYHAERLIEAFHGLIAAQEITVTAAPEGDDFQLSITMPALVEPPASRTTVRPLGVKVGARSLDESLVWRPVAIQNISPFVVLETTISTEDVTVTRACVVKANLVGDPELRHRMVLRGLLAKERDLLRYLALLLADPGFDALVKSLQEDLLGDLDGARTGYGHGVGGEDPIFFEPLLRAAARQDGSLKRVDSLFKELRDERGALPHLSKEFQDLWDVVWDAMKKSRA